ncbi:MAG: molecular chaperone TorD family protein [Alphaproteobacteria bacterium]|nr:molecular chaperone TorD family protein [Alphaproteobacteria bacterium]MCB9697927.1 molecular chaperone TorD family protein [Alphaproteobacteria bacterium]
MTGAELALARHRLHALLGWLIVEAPSAEARDAARSVPALAALCARDPEELAADHHALVTEVPPVLSAILGEDGLVGGPLQDAVRARFAASGFHPGRTDVPLDHLGLLLACAGHLCAAEHELLVDGGDPGQLRQLQRQLLDEQLLSWLPAWVVATTGVGGPLHDVAEMALELCLSHRAELGGPGAGWQPTADLPDLDAADTDLRAIGEALARPASSGWLPGRAAIDGVAASADVVVGFGGRIASLGETLRGAADLGRLGPLLQGLRRELSAWDTALEATGGPVDGWREGVRRSLALVDRLSAAVEGA